MWGMKLEHLLTLTKIMMALISFLFLRTSSALWSPKCKTSMQGASFGSCTSLQTDKHRQPRLLKLCATNCFQANPAARVPFQMCLHHQCLPLHRHQCHLLRQHQLLRHCTSVRVVSAFLPAPVCPRTHVMQFVVLWQFDQLISSFPARTRVLCDVSDGLDIRNL